MENSRWNKRTRERTESVTMIFDSLSQNEEFARVAAAVFLSRLDPTLEEIDDVKTAVSEAVTNAIIHGYRGTEGSITMKVRAVWKGTGAGALSEAAERILEVEILDEGVGIPDVEKAMEPMYTTAPGGDRSGMGFSFMEAFMDQVEVESAPGEGTRVIMQKRIGR